MKMVIVSQTLLVLTLLIGGITCSAQARADAPAAASTCVGIRELSTYMGTYKVVAVKRYGGGITSRELATQHMGTSMISLSTAHVSVSGNSPIKQPKYTIMCQPKPVEGEVVPPDARYSNFYGFGMDRKFVSVLQVRDPADKDQTPYYEFELLHLGGKQEIWYMDDEWLYELERLQ